MKKEKYSSPSSMTHYFLLFQAEWSCSKDRMMPAQLYNNVTVIIDIIQYLLPNPIMLLHLIVSENFRDFINSMILLID